MIYRLTYCNKEGVEARVDIQKGLATPVIEVEGAERPFILSYNNDKGDKSGMFLSSSADIEIYETPAFNINSLKTSNETELSVTHYINNVVSWQGFIIPDFFSIEVRSNPVITMTASDRLGTLKNVTLSDLPSMISLRELAILCLDKTGLELTLRTMADFNNGTGINDFFNSKILTQRLSDTKGRSISCYDILSSILTASNSFLVQRTGTWHIINKIQHEAGSGKLYTGATSFINWADVIFNFSDISIGGRRTIIPVASTVGVFHEFGGGKLHPDNYDFAQGTAGWVANGGYSMNIEDREIKGYSKSGSNWVADFGQTTTKKRLKVQNVLNFPLTNLDTAPYAKATFPLITTNTSSVDISIDMSVVGMPWYRTGVVILAEKGTTRLAFSQSSGKFESYDPQLATNPGYPDFMINLSLPVQGSAEDKSYYDASTKSMKFSGKLEDSDLTGWNITIRLYGRYSLQLGSRVDFPMFFSFANVSFSNTNEIPKGNIYKTEKDGDFTKAHDIDTSIFADYITFGLNGFFYEYPIDDTSSLYNSANELTAKWTAYNDPSQLPLLQHITRQRSRLFSVAHDLLSAEIEVNNFDPLAIFVACGKRHTVVSAQFDFFKSNLSVELEEIDFQSASARDFIYSYFGDGESGIKSVGGISGGSSGGGTSGGLTPEQIEILSWWKKDPDRENTIFTEMNAYSKLELSATKLQTARTIAGISFDGTANIAIPFANLSSKPTTLSGYGITDAYTKTEVNSALTSKLDKSVFDDLFEKVEVSTGVFAIKAKYNFYSVGETSAYGINSGGGSGGGGIIDTVYGYGNLGQAFNNSILTDTFNAYTINRLHERVQVLEAGGGGGGGSTVAWGTLTNGYRQLTVEGVTYALAQNTHTHLWADITDKPSTFTPSAHTHLASHITSGTFAIGRIPTGTTGTTVALGNHTHSWADITDKPSIFGSLVTWGSLSSGYRQLMVDGVTYALAQNTHTHLWADITDKPSTFTPSTHTHSAGDITSGTLVIARIPTGTTASTVALGNHTHAYNSLTGIPSTFAPSTHTHLWADITDKPSTFAPSAHTHSASDITSGTFAIARIPTGTTSSTVALGNHLHTGTYEPVFSKNTAFNKDFGTASGTVAEGNDSRITNGQTAYGWGNHASAGYALNSALSGYVTTSRIITAGNGLTGGGTLAADRTITLGTPSNITLSSTNSVTTASHTHNFTLGGTASQYLNGATTLVTIPTVTAGNGLTGGGQLTSGITLTLATPGTLTAATTNGVTTSSHTHAITTTSVGLANTIIQTDATGGTKLNNLMVGGNWKIEQTGTELLLKYNDLIAARFLADGSIVGLGEITAYGASTGGEGVALLRTGGTMIGNLTMSADIIMNSGRAIGVSNLPLKLLGNALTYNASNVLTEANTATQIKMGNGWTIEQTTSALTIKKNGVVKGTFNA